ncbi:hypothetical protein LC76P1_00020 [Lysinibacillus phage LC76P1]|nr:hypothetical protein LC76P1_00020 [Lysinibacillus phage LC76P1]
MIEWLFEHSTQISWLLIYPFAITFLSYQLAPKHELSFDHNFVWFGLLPIINWLIAVLAIIELFSAWNDGIIKNNKIMECKKCGIYTRNGYLEVQKRIHDKKRCPSCSYEHFNDTRLPWRMKIKSSKRLSLWKIKNLHNHSDKILMAEIQRSQEEKMLMLAREKERD